MGDCFLGSFEIWLEAYEKAPDLWPSFAQDKFRIALWKEVEESCRQSGEVLGIKCAKAWCILVDQFEKMEDFSTAAQAARKLTAIDPSPKAEYRRLRLEQWSQDGKDKVNGSRSRYRRFLARDDLPPALRSKAMTQTAYALWKDRIACEEMVRKALGVDDNNGEAWWLLAQITFRNGDRDLAVKWYDKCAACAPANSHVRAVCAALLMILGRDTEAEGKITEATRINGNASANWIDCADHLDEKLKNPGLAKVALARAAAVDEDGRACQLLALRNRKEGNSAKAAECMEKAILLGADTVENLTLLGQFYLDLKMPDQALSAYRGAIKQYPASPVPWNSYRVHGLAVAGEGGERREAAIRIAKELEGLARDQGPSPAAWAEIGLLHAYAGDIEKSAHWYLRAFAKTKEEDLRDNFHDLSQLAPQQLEPLAKRILRENPLLHSLVQVREYVRLQQAEHERRARNLAAQRRYFGGIRSGGGYNQAQARASQAASAAMRDYRNHISSHFGYLGF